MTIPFEKPTTPALFAVLLALTVGMSRPIEADARTARHPRASESASAASAARLMPPRVPSGGPPDERTVYRCGDRYSAQACSGAKPLDVADTRTADQRLQAADVAERDQHLAAWLEAQRRLRDAPASAPKKSRPIAAVVGKNKVCASAPGATCPAKTPETRRTAVTRKAVKRTAVTHPAAGTTPVGANTP